MESLLFNKLQQTQLMLSPEVHLSITGLNLMQQ